MIRYFLLIIALMAIPFSAHAQKISQEKFESMRAECLAVSASGSYASVDHQNATKKCLSSCPENLRIHNNRALTMCMGMYSLFKNAMGKKTDAPIAHVNGTLDYEGHHGWSLTDSDNAETSKHCARIVLAATNSKPQPLKGHQMMVSGIKEEPLGGSTKNAVLINVRLPADKTQSKDCTAEVIHLRCQPHRADLPICNP